MSNTGCGDKWDREPKRRAMQNGIRGQNDVLSGLEKKHTFLE